MYQAYGPAVKNCCITWSFDSARPHVSVQRFCNDIIGIKLNRQNLYLRKNIITIYHDDMLRKIILWYQMIPIYRYSKIYRKYFEFLRLPNIFNFDKIYRKNIREIMTRYRKLFYFSVLASSLHRYLHGASGTRVFLF